MTSSIVIGCYIIRFKYWETVFNIPWLIMPFCTNRKKALTFLYAKRSFNKETRFETHIPRKFCDVIRQVATKLLCQMLTMIL
jgi:hypothetical protein